MTTREELLNEFDAALLDEGSFVLPPPEQRGREVLPDKRSRIEEATTSIGGSNTLEWHVCFYWDNPAATNKNAHFWVQDRDTPTESARWHKNKNPRSAASPSFTQELVSWLRASIDVSFGTSTLRHIDSVSSDDSIERGTASVIMELDAGGFSRVEIAVWKDGAGDFQFQVIT
jgi:hypothetical protein